MIKVDAMGLICPMPIVEAKKAIEQLNGAGSIEVFVDNKTAVENLLKMAEQKIYKAEWEKIDEGRFRVEIRVGSDGADPVERPAETGADEPCEYNGMQPDMQKRNRRKKVVMAVSSDKMGEGNDELGSVLMRGFIFAQTQMESLPDEIIFYNGGAKLTVEGSHSLEDIRKLEAAGVSIMTCGTCLNYYGLTEKLQVGTVTNMYAIAQSLAGADLVIKP